MAPHSSILAWKIPWTEEPGRLQSMGPQRVGHDWATSLHFTSLHYPIYNTKEEVREFLKNKISRATQVEGKSLCLHIATRWSCYLFITSLLISLSFCLTYWGVGWSTVSFLRSLSFGGLLRDAVLWRVTPQHSHIRRDLRGSKSHLYSSLFSF